MDGGAVVVVVSAVEVEAVVDLTSVQAQAPVSEVMVAAARRYR